MAKGIAKRVGSISEHCAWRKTCARGIEHLSELASAQLKDGFGLLRNAQYRQNPEAIRARDEEIDAMYTSLFRELANLYDGRSAEYFDLYPIAVLRQEY